MSEVTTQAVVFDCVIFAQALINDAGPAGACLELARVGRFSLYWSDYVQSEICELPSKVPARFAVTGERVQAFIEDVGTFAHLVSAVPARYENPFDADDSHYVDLALASGATLISSRDQHLLKLMNESIPEGVDFRTRFPQLRIVTPEVLLQSI